MGPKTSLFGSYRVAVHLSREGVPNLLPSEVTAAVKSLDGLDDSDVDEIEVEEGTRREVQEPIAVIKT